MNSKSIVFLFLLAASSYGCSMSMPSLPSWGSGTKSDPTAEALYAEGIRNFNEKRYVRAIDDFNKIRTDFPFSPQVTEVELKIADAYYLSQQYPEAINAFKEYQSMHPTNEHIPFVLLRLGQAHFDQFSSVDRDQKNTEIAKGYFENVVNNYPKSPQAAEAKEKLAKCVEYLAEHDFNIAYFYFRQEKYPAARDRFEEIVRKYKDTPTAVKSLFYLGESYRKEKNSVRAALAYDALIEHYPQSKFATDARTQLAQLDKEKQDPLALLLMRDRRPAASAPEVKEDPALAKLKDMNLIAKTDVVHEEPGQEKGFLRRVADKLNPFSSTDNNATAEEKPSENTMEILAKRSQAQKQNQDSIGFLASVWPFGSKPTDTNTAPAAASNSSNLVNQIDSSLKQKGIDSASDKAALQPPAANLPNTDDMAKTPQTSDTAALLSSVDSNLKRGGKDGTTLPPVPEAAEGFQDAAAIQTAIAKEAAQNNPPPPKDAQSSGILSSIDQKLAAKGVTPGNFETPPTAGEVKAAAVEQERTKNKVELEPKFTPENGPLYLKPGEVDVRERSPEPAEAKTTEASSSPSDLPSRVLVKGPLSPQAVASAKAAEAKEPLSPGDDQPKNVLDQLKQDVESASKALSPFRW